MFRDFAQHLGHILGLTSLLILLELSRAFLPPTNKVNSSSTSTENKVETKFETKGFEARDVLNILPEARGPFDPIVDVVDVDINKARDFASHFGKYSYKEVEHMRDDLHIHRFKNDAPSDILFLERFLEDELTSQLLALKADMPDPYLFRKDTDIPSASLFGSENETETTPTPTTVASESKTETETETKVSFAAFKNLLEEGVVESLLICVVLGAIMMMTPQQEVPYDAYPYQYM